MVPDPKEFHLILASGSSARRKMLQAAGLQPTIEVPRIDEAAIRDALVAEGADPTDIAAELAEQKSLKISRRMPGTMVIGADQLVVSGTRMFSKPETQEEACRQIADLSGQRHDLLSAAVVSLGGRPIWRHVGKASVRFHQLEHSEIAAYVARNWDVICHTAGCYEIEGQGTRLIAAVEGDYFTILGLPLLELLTWLRRRGDITA